MAMKFAIAQLFDSGPLRWEDEQLPNLVILHHAANYKPFREWEKAQPKSSFFAAIEQQISTTAGRKMLTQMGQAAKKTKGNEDVQVDDLDTTSIFEETRTEVLADLGENFVADGDMFAAQMPDVVDGARRLIVGWEANDAEGEAIKFNQSNLAELLALPQPMGKITLGEFIAEGVVEAARTAMAVAIAAEEEAGNVSGATPDGV